jgi:hypothetical protein
LWSMKSGNEPIGVSSIGDATDFRVFCGQAKRRSARSSP